MRRLLCTALLLCCACLFGCAESPGAATPPLAAQPPAQAQALEKSREQAETAAASEASPEGARAEVAVPDPQATPTPAQTQQESENAVEKLDTLPEEWSAGMEAQAPPATETAPASFKMASVPEPYLQLVLEGLGLNISTDVFDIRITYQTEELFSCLVEIEEPNGATTKKPFTCSLRDGRPCELGTFFLDTDTGWKGLLPDLVTEAATERGMTLLCEVPPVTENHPYYIEDGSIVLLYRPYEITTYEAGTPSFKLDMQAIREYTSGAYGVGVRLEPEIAQQEEAE